MQLTYHDKTITLDKAWANLARDLGMVDFCLAEDGFRETLAIGRPPLAFQKRRSGIYFWLAENNEAYIGQAVDVQSRLRQHFKNHRDLICAAYLPVLPTELDYEERRLVAKAETAFRLRNVKLVKASASFRPFDEFLAPAEQSQFIESGNTVAWLNEPRRDFPMLEAQSRAKWAKYKKVGAKGDLLRQIVSAFVSKVVPRPLATENRFWSITYLGSGYARINVGQQELFTCDLDDDVSPIRILAPSRLKFFARRSGYETGDFENFMSLKKAQAVLGSNRASRSIRERVIWLARHTTPLNLRSHCPWLYDHAASKDAQQVWVR